MNKIPCPKCGVEVSAESGVMPPYCAHCGASAQLPFGEKTVFSRSDATIAVTEPKTRSQLPTILVTSFFTALFLILLFAGGVYWLINEKTINILPGNLPIESSKDIQATPTPRAKNRSSISAVEITKIEFSELTTRTRPSASQYFGNVNANNFTTRTSVISFSADGKAVKVVGESGAINGVQVSPTPQKYVGATTPEKFAELARVFVENDFLGEENSKTSTSLPINYTFNVAYSSGEKKFQTSNSGKDTPEAEAMLRAFKSLEKQVGWKME